MLKTIFILFTLLTTHCTTMEKISEESVESKKNQPLVVASNTSSPQNKRSPAWVTQNIVFEENTLGVSAKVEFEENKSPIEGLMLSDQAARKQFKANLNQKLSLFLSEQKEKLGLEEEALKHIVSSILETDATDKELYIDGRFYRKENSKLICYSFAKINLKNIGARFQKALGDDTEVNSIENLWHGFLSTLNSL